MKKLFTPEELADFEANPYTAKVTETQIKFTDDFKDDFWKLYLTDMPVKEIFLTLGYNPEVLGIKRTDGFVYNLRKRFLTPEQRSNCQSRTSITKRPSANLDYSEMKSIQSLGRWASPC